MAVGTGLLFDKLAAHHRGRHSVGASIIHRPGFGWLQEPEKFVKDDACQTAAKRPPPGFGRSLPFAELVEALNAPRRFEIALQQGRAQQRPDVPVRAGLRSNSELRPHPAQVAGGVVGDVRAASVVDMRRERLEPRLKVRFR